MRKLLMVVFAITLYSSTFAQYDTECKYASFSPDGKYIIYQSNIMGTWNIYAVRLDTHTVYPLTLQMNDNMQPAWSPDGTKFAFTTNRDNGNYEIYIKEFLGMNVTNLSMNEAADQYPNWSHDGELIAFSSDRVNSKMNVFVVKPNGEDLKMLTEGEFDEIRPIWSPNDTKIAYSYFAFDQLNPAYIDRKKGDESFQYLLWKHSSFPTSWDTKGEALYLSANHGNYGGENIYSFDLKIKVSELPTKFFEKCNTCSDASISPDGVHLVFSKRDSDGLSLYMVKTDGTQMQKIDTNLR